MNGRLLAGLALFLALAGRGGAELPEAAPPPPPKSLSSLPIDKGLPVIVRMALRYVEVTSIDEAEATYTATVDLRLRWQDLRLQVPSRVCASGLLAVPGRGRCGEDGRDLDAGGLFVESLRQALAASARPPDLFGWASRDDGADEGHVRDAFRRGKVSF